MSGRMTSRRGSFVTVSCPFGCGELHGDQAQVVLDPDASVSPDLLGCPVCSNAYAVEPKDGIATSEILKNYAPLSEVAPAGSVMANIFADLREIIGDLPVLAEIPNRVVAMVHDPLMSMKEVSQTIEEDAAFSMRVLKLANSVAFGGVSNVTDLNVACARLGPKVIINLAHAVGQRNIYRAKRPEYRNLVRQLWRHSVATAHYATELAKTTSGVDGQSMFITGLTRDIGKLVLLNAMTVRYEGQIGILSDSQVMLLKTIRRFSPLVGLHVVQHWRLGPAARQLVYYADAPDSVLDKRLTTAAHILALAGAMADAAGFVVGEEEDPYALLEEHASIPALELTGQAVRTRMEELSDGLDTVMSVLEA